MIVPIFTPPLFFAVVLDPRFRASSFYSAPRQRNVRIIILGMVTSIVIVAKSNSKKHDNNRNDSNNDDSTIWVLGFRAYEFDFRMVL